MGSHLKGFHLEFTNKISSVKIDPGTEMPNLEQVAIAANGEDFPGQPIGTVNTLTVQQWDLNLVY